MRIFLTGRSGQLGIAMMREFERDHEVVAPAHGDLEIRRHRDVVERVRACRPHAIINCAAFNDVDGSEDQAVEALEVNAFAVRSLAVAAAEVRAAFVHYSTDFVFSGEADRPYTEDDAPQPRGFYAASKLLGEWFAREAPRHYVLRVESLFGGSTLGSARKSSVDRIADAIFGGQEAVVFSDRTVSPSFVLDVSSATRRLIEDGIPYGLYHCVNGGLCTWLDLGRELASRAGIDATLVPRSVDDVRLRAARPKYCAMSNEKLAAAGIRMPDWRNALGRYLELRLAAGRH
jgi:dTDP-4-dehydrorhamnose reductase